MFIKPTIVLAVLFSALFSSCSTQSKMIKDRSYADDEVFLKKHTDIIVLRHGEAALAVAPAYQARVMTSAINAQNGMGFGWINRAVIEKGFMSPEEQAGKLEDHIYVFGGEDRFWLGPEGGQFGLFFAKDKEFEFVNWKTPPVIDTEAFELVKLTDSSAKFEHQCEIKNYLGTSFKVGIQRTVSILDSSSVQEVLGEIPKQLQFVAYETDNVITNQGDKPWEAETGLLSIWILGMYNPSPRTTVAIPFIEGSEKILGERVNDSYFGKVPEDYLKVEKDVLYFKGDGTRRGKIGLGPKRSKGIAGSYDADNNILNIVTYNQQEAPKGFVNSMWELQKEPYAGDVINSYNDGSPEPGVAPLGPFYELETSSPAAALKPGASMRHIQRTFHIQGNKAQLSILSKSLLGVSLETIESKF